MTNYEDLWDWCFTEVLKLPNGQDVWEQIQKCKDNKVSQTRNDLLREIMEEMPKRKILKSGWDGSYSGNLRADGFNDCHDQVNTLLERKLSTVKRKYEERNLLPS